MNEVLRQEKKYLLSYDQFRRLDHTFEQVLHPDSHNGKMGYPIRSLYFDTMQERDFYEKEDGLEIRRKIRLRTYSLDSDFAMLEMKQKQGENQKKRSLRLGGRMQKLCHGENIPACFTIQIPLPWSAMD